jgi:hypothetical protein
MADLNVFRNISKTVGTSLDSLYAAPATYTGIVLSSVVTNTSDSDIWLNFTIQDSTGDSATELLSQFTIPARDTLAATSGKLVVTANGILKVQAQKANKLKAVIGILESLDG